MIEIKANLSKPTKPYVGSAYTRQDLAALDLANKGIA